MDLSVLFEAAMCCYVDMFGPADHVATGGCLECTPSVDVLG